MFWSVVAHAALPLVDATPGGGSPEGADPLAVEGPADAGSGRVVGGRQVEPGRWDDAVGIVFAGAYVGCTGTLIGPKVVLTAGHCVLGYPITDVIVGSKNWLRDEGTAYPVEDVVEFPDSQRTRDIALVFLEEPVEDVPPRPIGMECITEAYLKKGAPVQIVGFGLTSESGQGFNSALNEAPSTVADPDCSETTINGVYAGCSREAQPAGEVAAGGDGVDACFGDSGGPLYLKTDEGDFVIGATSRAFLGVNPNYPCRDGGIWVRPDAVVDWILKESGKRAVALPTCNEPPVADDVALTVRGTKPGEVELAIDDPDGDASAAVLEITVPPEHGTATVTGSTIEYVADDGYVGPDLLAVTVTDAGTDWKYSGKPASVDVLVDVTVEKGGLFGCGCTSTAGASPAIGALALALVVARRRTAA